mmetsp:Transcript_47954/g.77875  ORF Transcript_47954/g.77875 Transcript_47954/m.77875 type:complete len:214 (+) Transcript_47954:268-909(+)
MKLVEVFVLDCLLHAHAAIRIPSQHFAKKVLRIRGHLWQGLGEELAFVGWQGLDELAALVIWNLHELLVIRGAQELDYHIKLILCIVPREKWFSRLQLGQDAANGPDVDGTGVICPGTEDLWSAIPPSAHILSHGADPFLVRETDSSKTKIANLQVTVAVYQQVSRLEIPMNHLSRMNVLHTAKDLVDEELAMVVCKLLRRPQGRGQVRLHEF